MSIEMHVFFRGKLPNKRELSRAMAELGFPLTIAPGSLERQNGFMPMRLRREETGVEFDVYNERADIQEIAGEDFDPRFERSANFRWGGSEDEMLCGLCAAAALAKLIDGTVLDGESGKLLSLDEAIAQATHELQRVLKSQETRRRGTRSADLRHYLKPLLKQRTDLVLIGRMLVVRPVRHILRGAFLKGRGDYILAYRFMDLLCQPLGETGYPSELHQAMLDVWKPHFDSLLMNTLAEDIFEEVGKVTSLDDFAAAIPTDGYFVRVRATALHLSGRRDRAAAHLQDVEADCANNFYWKPWYESQRKLLTTDVGEICALYHAREAKAVKALKLERIWEPSPFPAELPEDQRKARSDETLFIPQPWPQRPEWLVAELPEQVGEVRFAKELHSRRGHPILVVPLGREQAEARHRNWENYVLGVRLSDKLLLLLRQDGRDLLDPDRVTSPTGPASLLWDVRLELRGSDHVVDAEFRKDWKTGDTLTLESVKVRSRAARWRDWTWSIRSDDGRKRIWDGRTGERIYTNEPLADAERDQLTLRVPNFGEFEALVRIVLATLRSEGFGEIA